MNLATSSKECKRIPVSPASGLETEGRRRDIEDMALQHIGVNHISNFCWKKKKLRLYLFS